MRIGTWAGITCALAVSLCGADWKAGVARVDITPSQPLWMAGFAARTKPSEGMLAPVMAKALALRDTAGNTSVLVTADILGFIDEVSEPVAARVKAKHGILRERLVFNGSHTHWGPVIGRQLQAAYPMTAEQWADVDRYTAHLIDKITAVIDAALKEMQPATLSYSETSAGFASNYRTRTEKGYVHKANPAGPVERVVPVMKVSGENGAAMAIVFGYSCHPTVASGADRLYHFHGDYAGFAQAQLEREFPGATALFVQGFGGDAKGEPRGTVALSQQHGAELAANVAKSVRGAGVPVRGPIKAVFDRVTLDFDPAPSREEWERRAKTSTNPSEPRRARVMLAELDRKGKIDTQYRYPIQAWQFGNDLTFVALGGETLIDYATRFRKELGVGRLWVAGYSNDVSCYIPPVRVLDEGGYEPDESMIYYARPNHFAHSVEERIVSKTKSLVSKLTK